MPWWFWFYPFGITVVIILVFIVGGYFSRHR